MKKQLILFFIFFTSILHAKEEPEKPVEKQSQKIDESYREMVDRDFSPFSGAQNILFFHEAMEKSISSLFPNKQDKRAIYAILRIAEIGFIWGPLARAEIVVQHEVFGHGYRIRDIGSTRVRVKEYRIDLPPPYGDGGGSTRYRYNSRLTSFQNIAIALGGTEASAILANRLKMNWMESLRLDPKKAPLYLQSQFDLTNYILSMKDTHLHSDTGHDIKGYIYWLNNTYFDDILTKAELKKAVLINYLDPMTYYSIGSYFYYIFTGKDIRIPLIDIKGVKFLPNLRLGLAPYGPEYFVENFFSYKNRAIYSYARFGEHNNNYYWGVGLEYPKLYEFNLNTIGFRFDVFHQPKIYSKEGITTFEGVQVGYSSDELNKMIYGVSANIIYYRKFTKKSNISFFTELGYKTDGYIPGFSLEKGSIVRLGIGFASF